MTDPDKPAAMKPSEIAASLPDEERKSRMMAAVMEMEPRRKAQRAAWDASVAFMAERQRRKGAGE